VSDNGDVPQDRATQDRVVADALAASRPRRAIAFARPSSNGGNRAELELVMHLTALANSGGGAVVVRDAPALAALGAAGAQAALETYTGEHIDVEMRNEHVGDRDVAVFIVDARADAPAVFEKTGTWHDEAGAEHIVFGRGTVFFRHGRNSDPATARDMHRFAERVTRQQHRAWETNVKKAAHAPADADVYVVQRKTTDAGTLAQVRVVDDPNAPAVARTDFDITHPYRQREVVDMLNARAGEKIATGYDVQSVRKAFHTDERPEFFHRPKFGSPQYSEAFVTWMLDEYRRDPAFFEIAKHIVRPPKAPEPEEEAG
jgi:hypothetical protein